jgi:short subunit dehydrogenase-like uncharacterized protein
LSAEVHSLLKSVTHRLHLVVFRRIYVELIRSEVAKLRVLVFHGHFILTPRTFIEEACLKKTFQFHDDHGQVVPVETFRQHFAKEADDALVEGRVVIGVGLDDTFKLDVAVCLALGVVP